MLLWMMPDSGSNTKKDFENFFAPFIKENPGIDVKVEFITRQNLWNKLFLMRFENNADGMPDIIETPDSWTRFMTAADMIENLNALDPGLSIGTSLSPLAARCYKPGTKDIYALPWWMDVMALHYRADHLAKVSKNPAEDLKTWPGLLEICEKLKDNFKQEPNYSPLQNSDWRGSLSSRSMLPCVWGRGSDLFDANLKKSCFNDENFILGCEDYIALAQKNYMPILRERGSVGTMVSGRASMFMTRRQGVGAYQTEKSRFEIQTLPIPATGAESVAFMSGINLVVNKKSKNKDNALKIIKWLARPENQLKYAALTETFPAHEESFNQFISSSAPRMKVYNKIVASAHPLPAVMTAAPATKILNEVLDRVATEIVKGLYKKDFLVKELYNASKEADYLYNLYDHV